MSDGRECRTCGGKWSIRDASQCPFCRCDGYRKENEALKAEVEVLSNGECLGCKDHEDTLKRELRESDRAEKAEAERDRLREALETVQWDCMDDLSGAANEFIKKALNHDKSSNRQ